MDWETETPTLPDPTDADIPGELLDGLERVSRDSRLLAVRFRWRPHQTAATGFLTKNRLQNIDRCSSLEIARAVTAYAMHLHEEGGCESKFEAQVRRELHEPLEDGTKREWRSITFRLDGADSFSDHDMSFDDDRDPSPHDDNPTWGMGPALGSASRTDYDDYARFMDLSRSDPAAFALLVTQQSSDRVVNILERLLNASVGRLDGILSRQISSSRYLNEALQTLTRGAGDIAGLGVNLFQQGLEGQAKVARMEHETEIGKERTELMRDAVKQGSLLIQAIMMSNAAKRGQAPSAPPPRATRPSPPPSSAQDARRPSSHESPPSPPDPQVPQETAADRDLVTRAETLLGLITDETLANLRTVAPSLVAVFEELRERSLTGAVVREVIISAQQTVSQLELAKAGEHFDENISSAFASLLMRVLSENM